MRLKCWESGGVKLWNPALAGTISGQEVTKYHFPIHLTERISFAVGRSEYDWDRELAAKSLASLRFELTSPNHRPSARPMVEPAEELWMPTCTSCPDSPSSLDAASSSRIAASYHAMTGLITCDSLEQTLQARCMWLYIRFHRAWPRLPGRYLCMSKTCRAFQLASRHVFASRSTLV